MTEGRSSFISPVSLLPSVCRACPFCREFVAAQSGQIIMPHISLLCRQTYSFCRRAVLLHHFCRFQSAVMLLSFRCLLVFSQHFSPAVWRSSRRNVQQKLPLMYGKIGAAWRRDDLRLTLSEWPCPWRNRGWVLKIAQKCTSALTA